jgi:hypothetical protein
VNGLSTAIIQVYAQQSRAATDTDGPAVDREQPYAPISFPRSSPSAVPWGGQNFTYTDPAIIVNIADDVSTRERSPRTDTAMPANIGINVHVEDSDGHINISVEELA